MNLSVTDQTKKKSLFHLLRFKYRVKVGENLFAESSAPSKKAARQLAAEEAVKELMADGKLQLNKVMSWNEKRGWNAPFHIFNNSLLSKMSSFQPLLPLGPSSDGEEGSSSGAACPSLPPLTADELRAAHEAGVGDLINHLNNNAVSGLLEYARARGFAAEIRLVGQSGPPHEPKYVRHAQIFQSFQIVVFFPCAFMGSFAFHLRLKNKSDHI